MNTANVIVSAACAHGSHRPEPLNGRTVLR